MRGWKKIADDKVLHVWKCECGAVEITVQPTFYEQSGTPIIGDGQCRNCEGQDAVYSHTLIKSS